MSTRLPDVPAAGEVIALELFRGGNDHARAVTAQSGVGTRLSGDTNGAPFSIPQPLFAVPPSDFSGLIRFPENRKYTVPTPWDLILLVHFDTYTAEWIPVEPTPCPAMCQVYPRNQLHGDLIIPRL